jgi:hypothetical protein
MKTPNKIGQHGLVIKTLVVGEQQQVKILPNFFSVSNNAN